MDGRNKVETSLHFPTGGEFCSGSRLLTSSSPTPPSPQSQCCAQVCSARVFWFVHPRAHEQHTPNIEIWGKGGGDIKDNNQNQQALCEIPFSFRLYSSHPWTGCSRHFSKHMWTFRRLGCNGSCGVFWCNLAAKAAACTWLLLKLSFVVNSGYTLCNAMWLDKGHTVCF